MGPHVDVRRWVSYSEIAGTARLTQAEFRANLIKFPRSGVLIAIARISTIFGFGPEGKKQLDLLLGGQPQSFLKYPPPKVSNPFFAAPLLSALSRKPLL